MQDGCTPRGTHRRARIHQQDRPSSIGSQHHGWRPQSWDTDRLVEHWRATQSRTASFREPAAGDATVLSRRRAGSR